MMMMMLLQGKARTGHDAAFSLIQIDSHANTTGEPTPGRLTRGRENFDVVVEIGKTGAPALPLRILILLARTHTPRPQQIGRRRWHGRLEFFNFGARTTSFCHLIQQGRRHCTTRKGAGQVVPRPGGEGRRCVARHTMGDRRGRNIETGPRGNIFFLVVVWWWESRFRFWRFSPDFPALLSVCVCVRRPWRRQPAHDQPGAQK
ncbi:hypothetical protein QBC39DRAFT_340449 [Podospora conica]|nr:hypothetical protein QBC39DRAFT_340449 [Schizothecium conicum]